MRKSKLLLLLPIILIISTLYTLPVSASTFWMHGGTWLRAWPPYIPPSDPFIQWDHSMQALNTQNQQIEQFARDQAVRIRTQLTNIQELHGTTYFRNWECRVMRRVYATYKTGEVRDSGWLWIWTGIPTPSSGDKTVLHYYTYKGTLTLDNLWWGMERPSWGYQWQDVRFVVCYHIQWFNNPLRWEQYPLYDEWYCWVTEATYYNNPLQLVLYTWIWHSEIP